MSKHQIDDISKVNQAKKMMLWFAIVSLSMAFAGLTSAYVVSAERPDWIESYTIPTPFYISLVVMLISSGTIHLAKKHIQRESNRTGMYLLLTTFALGIVFIILQFMGFSEFIRSGYYFTGSESNITTSYIYLIVLLHVAHLLAGLLTLLVVIYNHYKQKYINGKTLGIEQAATFWHFLDGLWIYLLLFFYFVR
ncbi:MAG TPA: cytochrome c oxidase subunit 3 [Flavobacteriaceae bacterium]|nr:cytochrome c oxidase subunit 3 [Flavobacteriaceae bacterium]